MKFRYFFLLAATLLFAGAVCAQNKDGGVIVTLSTITTKMTTREKILRHPRLIPQTLGCDVTSFEVSITSAGKTWGPVKVTGTLFNVEVYDKIKETDPADVKLDITHIQVKCGGSESTAPDIHLEYNH